MTLANVTISSGTINITNVAVSTANVSGTANISTLVVVGNTTAGGNVSIGGNVSVSVNATVSGNASVTGNVSGAGGSFSSITSSGDLTLSGGTANGVLYLNGSKVATSGSALTFNGTNFATTASNFDLNPASGNPNISLREGNTYRAYIEGNSSGLLFGVGASATEGMRLTSTGLGIGTSSPARKLVVIGSGAVSSDFYAGYLNTTANVIASANVANGGAGYSQFLVW